MAKRFGPTFETVERNSVIQQSDHVIFRIDEMELQGHENPNKKLSAKASEDIFLYRLQTKATIIESDVESDVGKKFEPFVGLSHYSKLCHGLLEQGGMGYILDLFDPRREGYVGDEGRPNFDSVDELDGWLATAQLFIAGEMEDAQGTVFSCPEGGLVGKEYTVSVGKVGTDTDSNGDAKDKTGWIEAL